MKSRVRFVTRKWGPTVGGMETYCMRLCDELAQYCELEVIALAGRSKNQMPSAFGLGMFGLLTIFKLLTRPVVSVTHVGDMASWPFAWVAKKRNPSGLVVISAHGSDITFAAKSGLLPRFYRCYLVLGARAIGNEKVICNSKWLAGRARQYGYGNITVIPLGTDFHQIDPLFTGCHNESVFFAGRIVKSKGLAFLVEQVLPLLPAGTSIRVAGILGDRSQASVLLHSAVEFLGSLGAEELYEEYANAMCVVVPSQAVEGFGLVAAEAACAGGVVIASKHSGLLEICSDGVGMLVAANIPVDWADQIKRVSSWSRDERSVYSQSVAKKARNRFSWKVVAKDTFEAYGVAGC